MYYFLVLLVFACMLILCIVLAMCSWVDVDPSEEPQYQYQEQLSSEHFEQQQEQYKEGKYNMNNLSPFKYIFILHFNTVCL